MQCPECRAAYIPRRSDQVYCSSKCNSAGEARGLARARAVYRALYWWRYDRRNCGANLLFVCRQIAHWIQEDRLSQRGPPPRHNHDADRGYLRQPPRPHL